MAGLLFAFQVVAESTKQPVIGLIVKTENNPFFVAMAEAAKAKAIELGVELRFYAGEYDGDTPTQVAAIGQLVEANAVAILLAPSDPKVLSGAVAKAREAGVMVIAIDTPFEDASSVDATFATDNFRAGELVGKWVKARLGSAVDQVKLATLDGSGTQVTVEVQRNQGFLHGMGVDIAEPGVMYDEADSRIVAHAATFGTTDGGRSAMRNLIERVPEVNLVFAINEPAAAGAYQALKSLGRENDVLIVSIDGGCQGVEMVASGEIGATVMQYPGRMVSKGIEAALAYVSSGEKPVNSPGLDFYDTGTTLVTSEPVAGLQSMSGDEARSQCWN